MYIYTLTLFKGNTEIYTQESLYFSDFKKAKKYANKRLGYWKYNLSRQSKIFKNGYELDDSMIIDKDDNYNISVNGIDEFEEFSVEFNVQPCDFKISKDEIKTSPKNNKKFIPYDLRKSFMRKGKRKAR